MSKEIGPRERQLREMRERRFADRNVPPPKLAALREKVATIKTKPPKPKKGKRR